MEVQIILSGFGGGFGAHFCCNLVKHVEHILKYNQVIMKRCLKNKEIIVENLRQKEQIKYLTSHERS